MGNPVIGNHEPEQVPKRRRPAHGVLFPPSQPVIVFLTVCTQGRAHWLAAEDCHALLVSIWRRATAWYVGRYVLMPDHLHLFAAPGDKDVEFDPWVRYWKSQFSKARRRPAERWQVGHWDRRLQSNESYREKWEYVQENPVRHKLCERSGDWAYQGEVFEIDW